MKNKVSMVDITNKNITFRTAKATGKIYFSKNVYNLIKTHNLPKGNVLTTAQVAGILAAKNVPYIIPLCHPLNISYCNIKIELKRYNNKYFCEVLSEVTTEAKTGPDIEAIFATLVSLVTIYDMIKQFCPEAIISEVKLLSKTGGKTNLG
ncbi:MAG: cyclic pyranopterin monophosphate synthase MoaC [Endomicrobia bacterium]|nr:cyclic pyranopterin monophosphate synthase MoaC [Endomicrobiia bacterium]MCX7716144.1 cyclic pyranopterin monophosphate synthase MoaC [Endomicrobiia bacterium]